MCCGYAGLVTLLICASGARAETPEGALFDAVTAQLDRRYPLAFSVVATSQPPQQLPRSAVRDWVTLPASEPGPWRDSEQCATKLLFAFARQVKPRATLLLGDPMRRLRARCAAFANVSSVFGREFGAESDEDFASHQLFDALDALLPAAVVVAKNSSIDDVERTLISQATRPEIQLFWESQVAASCADMASMALELTPGPVNVQFRLRDVVKRPPRGLLRLYRLSRRLRSRVSVSFVAEEGVALRCSEGITRIFSHRSDER